MTITRKPIEIPPEDRAFYRELFLAAFNAVLSNPGRSDQYGDAIAKEAVNMANEAYLAFKKRVQNDV